MASVQTAAVLAVFAATQPDLEASQAELSACRGRISKQLENLKRPAPLPFEGELDPQLRADASAVLKYACDMCSACEGWSAPARPPDLFVAANDPQPPKPSAEDMAIAAMEAVSIMVEAFVSTAGYDAGRSLLMAVPRILAQREQAEMVAGCAPSAQRAGPRTITAKWLRRSLPRWLSRLPESA